MSVRVPVRPTPASLPSRRKLTRSRSSQYRGCAVVVGGFVVVVVDDVGGTVDGVDVVAVVVAVVGGGCAVPASMVTGAVVPGASASPAHDAVNNVTLSKVMRIGANGLSFEAIGNRTLPPSRCPRCHLLFEAGDCRLRVRSPFGNSRARHAVVKQETSQSGVRWAVELEEAISWLRGFSVDELRARGLSVEGTFDEIDDPVLLGPDGTPVESWREDHPYEERMGREEYEETKRLLQIELLKAQRWLQSSGKRMVIGFDGRDAAGKGGTIKRFIEHLNPRGMHVIALPAPSERERGQWYFQRYVPHLPTFGEITMFDRSWYNRAVVEPVMGFCSDEEYEEFMRSAPLFEGMLTQSGLILIKLWFSVSRLEQLTRFTIRRIDPVRQWKLSSNDLASLDRWDDYTHYKDEMFRRTHHPHGEWTVVRSNDKKRGRIEAMRFVLSKLDYPKRDDNIVGRPDPLIVGPPSA